MADKKISDYDERDPGALTDFVEVIPTDASANYKMQLATVLALISGLDVNTAPDVADVLHLIDDPEGTPASQQITLADAMKVIGGLTELASGIDFDADSIPLYDADAAMPKRILAKLLMQEYGTRAVIHDETLAVDGTFDIQNIPATFAHLELIMYLRSDFASPDDWAVMRFNGDSGANYSYAHVFFAASDAMFWDALHGEAKTYVRFVIPGDTALSNSFVSSSYNIPNYANTIGLKAGHGESFDYVNTIDQAVRVGKFGGTWKSVAAINRITITPLDGTKFKAGSRISIYGLNA